MHVNISFTPIVLLNG